MPGTPLPLLTLALLVGLTPVAQAAGPAPGRNVSARGRSQAFVQRLRASPALLSALSPSLPRDAVERVSSLLGSTRLEPEHLSDTMAGAQRLRLVLAGSLWQAAEAAASAARRAPGSPEHARAARELDSRIRRIRDLMDDVSLVFVQEARDDIAAAAGAGDTAALARLAAATRDQAALYRAAETGGPDAEPAEDGPDPLDSAGHLAVYEAGGAQAGLPGIPVAGRGLLPEHALYDGMTLTQPPAPGQLAAARLRKRAAALNASARGEAPPGTESGPSRVKGISASPPYLERRAARLEARAWQVESAGLSFEDLLGSARWRGVDAALESEIEAAGEYVPGLDAAHVIHRPAPPWDQGDPETAAGLSISVQEHWTRGLLNVVWMKSGLDLLDRVVVLFHEGNHRNHGDYAQFTAVLQTMGLSALREPLIEGYTEWSARQALRKLRRDLDGDRTALARIVRRELGVDAERLLDERLASLRGDNYHPYVLLVDEMMKRPDGEALLRGALVQGKVPALYQALGPERARRLAYIHQSALALEEGGHAKRVLAIKSGVVRWLSEPMADVMARGEAVTLAELRARAAAARRLMEALAFWSRSVQPGARAGLSAQIAGRANALLLEGKGPDEVASIVAREVSSGRMAADAALRAGRAADAVDKASIASSIAAVVVGLGIATGNMGPLLFPILLAAFLLAAALGLVLLASAVRRGRIGPGRRPPAGG